MFDNSQVKERSIIVACDLGENKFIESIKELQSLIDTAGADVIEVITQKREKADPATYVGSGKLLEIKQYCEENDINFIVFDNELTPSQVNNIQDVLDMPVLDRTMIILDIFAKRAMTNEGKLQVELAQLRYSLPRLRGLGKALSRQGGQVGTRGPGETKLETNRRHVMLKIKHLNDQLTELNERNLLVLKRREKNNAKLVAIIGYTNVGKSTLLNSLTNAGVLAENKLFATLDTTTKALTLPQGETVLISDTVGFIRKLPTQLIQAFKSTLNQIVYADLVVIVCDYSDKERHTQIKTTLDIVKDLGYMGEIVIVYNKCDKVDGIPEADDDNEVYISAKTGINLDKFLITIQNKLQMSYKKFALYIPYSQSKEYYTIKSVLTVVNESFDDNFYVVEALLNPEQYNKYSKYIKNE